MFLKISFVTLLCCFTMQIQAEDLDRVLQLGAAENPANLAGESAAFSADGSILNPDATARIGSGLNTTKNFDQTATPTGGLVNPTSVQNYSAGRSDYAGTRFNQTVSGNTVNNSGYSINSGNTVNIR